MVDERDYKENLPHATVLVIGMREPYPTGSPPDGTLIPGRVHTPQELTDGPVGAEGSPWEEQRKANMAAGGLIKGGAAWTEPVIP